MILVDSRKIRRAKKHGILMPRRLLKAARWAKIPYWAACAWAMQETSGGRNIWGHDGGEDYPFYGHGDGKVTKCNYRVYRIEARRTGKRQGVGPLQLTHSSFQDRADELGGCWKPYHNMQAAFEAIRGWRTDGATWPAAARRYNPSDRYVLEMRARFKFWRRVFDVPDEEGDDDE